MIHDIAYSNHPDTDRRSIADKILSEKAWQRVTSSDASLGERTAGLAVVAAMKAKSAVGGGKRRSNRRNIKRGRGGNKKKQSNKRHGVKKPCSKNSKRKRKTGKVGQGLYLRPYRNVY